MTFRSLQLWKQYFLWGLISPAICKPGGAGNQIIGTSVHTLSATSLLPALIFQRAPPWPHLPVVQRALGKYWRCCNGGDFRTQEVCAATVRYIYVGSGHNVSGADRSQLVATKSAHMGENAFTEFDVGVCIRRVN